MSSRRINCRLDLDVKQFVDSAMEHERKRLGWKTTQNLPKGELISRCIRQSKEYREWLQKQGGKR